MFMKLFGVFIDELHPKPANETRRLPQAYVDKLMRMGVAIDEQNPIRVCEKSLTESDVKQNLNRLLISKQYGDIFLRPDELDLLCTKCESGKPNKIGVKVVDPKLVVRDMSLAKWGMGDVEDLEERKMRGWFTLNRPWMEVVEANGFREGDNLQVWAFRLHGVLGFVVYKDPVDRKDDVKHRLSDHSGSSSGSSSGSGSGSGLGSSVTCL